MGKKKNGADDRNVLAELVTHTTGAVERRRYHQRLPVKLESAEAALVSQELTTATCSRVAMENEAAILRESIKGLKAKENELVGQLQLGTEMRDVEVVEYLLPNNSVQCVRSDTGEVVDSRTANAADLQEPLPHPDYGKSVAGDPSKMVQNDAAAGE
jgi:hypothetical protein